MAARLVWIAVLVCLPLLHCQQSLPPCNEKIKCVSLQMVSFVVHGKSVPIALSEAYLKENQTTDACAFDFADALFQCYPKPPTEIKQMILGMKCVKRRHVVFVNTELTGYEEVVFQAQIHNCILSLDDMDWVGNVLDFRVFVLFDSEILPSTKADDTNHTYSGLKKIVSLSVANSNSTNRLETLFPRPDVFKSMAEVSFHNMSIRSLPEDFSVRMPTLQSLDLTYNNLTAPPNFPWYHENQSLPRNLSRTNIFNNRYTTLTGTEVDPHLFRRYFHLNHNRIKTLQGHSFSGRVQLLSLSGNELSDFGDEVLANVTGLQRLDLSKNNLTFLSPGVFSHSGLKTLRGINLQGNLLQSIDNETFGNLTNLSYLNLADNKIRELGEGTFARLLKLETLHLENNQLEFISAGCFPSESTNLKEILLSNNRFKQIPSEIFTVGNIGTIDLSDCQISLDTLGQTLDKVSSAKMFFNAEPALATSGALGRQLHTHVIKLNRNNITAIPVYNSRQFDLMMVMYKLELEGNPIECMCRMSELIHYIKTKQKTGIFDGTEYFFRDFMCQSPPEFSGRKALSLNPSDLYCPNEVEACPTRCECFNFHKSKTYMVNCSDALLAEFPPRIPAGTIELRLAHNNISQLPGIQFHCNLRKLDLSFNQIATIDATFFDKVLKLKYLNLQHNVLTMLPENLVSLDLTEVELSDNHFRCDCHMLWSKDWIWKNKAKVKDWNRLTCLHGHDQQSPIVQVPDNDFICVSSDDWIYQLAIALSVVVLVALITGVLVYRFRLDLQALLFVRFNIRLFRKKELAEKDFALDSFVVASQANLHWAENNIYNVLKESKLITSVALSFKDFLIGFSYQDNFDLLVDNSAKIVVLLSDKFFQDELCVASLQKAVRISLAKRTKSVVLVAMKSFSLSLVKSATVRRFLRAQKIFCFNDKLLREKLLYCLARPQDNGHLGLQNVVRWEHRLKKSVPKTTRTCDYDLYLANSDADYQWVSDNVNRRLEAEEWKTCVPARDFICGAPFDAQVVETLQKSRYAMLVLSNGDSPNVDWGSFVIRMARQVSVEEHRNFLIVLVLEGTDLKKLNEETQTYLNTHSYLRQDDPDWWRKLMSSITCAAGCCAGNHCSVVPIPDVANVGHVKLTV